MWNAVLLHLLTKLTIKWTPNFSFCELTNLCCGTVWLCNYRFCSNKYIILSIHSTQQVSCPFKMIHFEKRLFSVRLLYPVIIRLYSLYLTGSFFAPAVQFITLAPDEINRYPRMWQYYVSAKNSNFGNLIDSHSSSLRRPCGIYNAAVSSLPHSYGSNFVCLWLSPISSDVMQSDAIAVWVFW